MEEFNINEFAKMFDAALASDNPAVKKALRNFLMVVALVESTETDKGFGPFQNLIQEIQMLRNRIDRLETTSTRVYQTTPWSGTTGISYPNTWISSSTSSVTSSTGSITNGIGNNTYTSFDLNNLLKDLETEYGWSNSDIESLKATMTVKGADAN